MARLAILGAAHIHTPNFVRMLGAREDHRVEAVYDDDVARAARTAQALGAQVASSVRDALSDADAVIICSETATHASLVDAAAGARKHLFVEKPLGMGAADAARMRRAIDSAGVLFQTGFFQRGQPAYRFIKQHVDAATFGRIVRIRHSNCHAAALKGWFDEDFRWMADTSRAGVGGFGDMGAHSLDMIVWLMGPVRAVAAAIGVGAGRYGACDDHGEALLELANGATATITAGWVDYANPLSFALSGTEGSVWVAQGQLFVVSEALGTDGRRPWTDLPAPLPHAFEGFLDALSGRPAELVPVADAAYECVVMEALYTAARERRWVDVEG